MATQKQLGKVSATSTSLDVEVITDTLFALAHLRHRCSLGGTICARSLAETLAPPPEARFRRQIPNSACQGGHYTTLEACEGAHEKSTVGVRKGT